MRRLLIATLLAVATSLIATAQRFEWDVDFNTVFDNREGDNKLTDTRTFFHTQLSPEIGVSLLDGEHRLMGGIVWTQPIGCEWYGHRLSPTLYYQYRGPKGWNLSLGMFPRALLLHPMPEYIWNDSTYYTQHNIRGAATTYQGRNGFFQAVVDWRAMQSETQREAFNIIINGEYQRRSSIFVAGGLAMMNHFALTKSATPDQHIVDNFIVNAYAGLDLSRLVSPLDSLTLRIGPLASITRNRADGVWKVPVGARLELLLQWKWLQWHNITYAGGRLFPYYSDFHALLDQGEPYYSTRFYNRTSVAGTIFSNQYVNLRASLDFNVASHNFTFYQRLILRVYIDSSFRKLTKGYRISSIY